MIARSRAIYLYSFRCKAARTIGSRLGETMTIAFNWVEKQISFLLNIIRGTFTGASFGDSIVWSFLSLFSASLDLLIGVRRLFLNAFLGERTSRSTRNSRLAGRILNGRLFFVSIEWKRSMKRNESWEWAWRRLLKYEKKRKVYYAYAINANSRRASDEDKSERKSCDRSYRTRSK